MAQISQQFIEKYISPVIALAGKVPQVVSLEVTTRCQLDCIYCTRDKANPQDLGIDQVMQLRERLRGVQKIIICGIGESFCYPHIYEIVQVLKDFKISIITNGAVPIDFARLNQEKNVELLVFSIDATTAEKMQTICRGYNFKTLEDNLMGLWKFPQIARIINTTLNVHNLEEIPHLVEFAAKYKLLAVNFELPIGDVEFVAEHKLEIKEQIKEGIKVAKKNNLVFNQFYRLTCNTGGWIIPNIRINGDFYPCCNGMNKGTLLGNLYTHDLAEVWREKAQPLLEGLDYCSECNLVKNLVVAVE